ncbi:hypothetical protein [Gallaecimonas mangrovi]|uniref:hypothetical protein n=1 Tax=Gallaecimonas mangrovi TaxID=2291597 RepID=UPI000E1FDCC4|nr:hypothetical protein [Gallaecimonas mangrovi]
MTQEILQLDPRMSAADLVRECMRTIGQQGRDDITLDVQLGGMTLRLDVRLTELNGEKVS